MGEPMKILDLAKEMIRRHGLEPVKDIAIEFTGIRPGEKLYEELACATDQTRPTTHPKIHVWQLPRATPRQIEQMLGRLTSVINEDRHAVVEALRQCVPEYQPDPGTVAPGIPSLRIVADAA
jgi:FlaA1/EpsC-like NDP-sugar epimerase